MSTYGLDQSMSIEFWQVKGCGNKIGNQSVIVSFLTRLNCEQLLSTEQLVACCKEIQTESDLNGSPGSFLKEEERTARGLVPCTLQVTYDIF